MLVPLLAFAALFALAASAKGSTPSAPPLPDSDFDYMIEDEGDLIMEEDDGEFVYEGSGYEGIPMSQMRSIQHYLAVLDFYDGDVNGVFTYATEDAIRDFQGWVGLPQSGAPTPETLETLASVIVNMSQPDYMVEDEGDLIMDEDEVDAPAPNVLVLNDYYPSGQFPDLQDVPYPRVVVRGDRVSLAEKTAIVAPFADAYPGVWFVVYQHDGGPNTGVVGRTSFANFTSGLASSNMTLGPKIQETLDILAV